MELSWQPTSTSYRSARLEYRDLLQTPTRSVFYTQESRHAIHGRLGAGAIDGGDRLSARRAGRKEQYSCSMIAMLEPSSLQGYQS